MSLIQIEYLTKLKTGQKSKNIKKQEIPIKNAEKWEQKNAKKQKKMTKYLKKSQNKKKIKNSKNDKTIIT